MEGGTLEVGQHIRFFSKDGSASMTGMISAVNNEQSPSTYDIILDNSDSSAEEEELAVPHYQIRPLEGFELGNIANLSISELKACGNVLFGLKDFTAAARYYQTATQKASKLYKVSIGSNVIVLQHPELPKGLICVDGMVSDSFVNTAGEEEFEVLLSNQSEISGVKLSNLLALPQDREGLVLLRSIYLNLARCDLKRERKGWAIHYASIAVAISEVMRSDLEDKGSAETDDVDRSTEMEETRQLAADALYFRAKTFLAAARPGLASQDLRSLQMFDHSKRVAQLKTEIDTFRLKRTKDNQRLAKDIARWVDDVMTGKAKREKDADIAVVDDFDENDGSSAATAK
jgi:hypothetical protein